MRGGEIQADKVKRGTRQVGAREGTIRVSTKMGREGRKEIVEGKEAPTDYFTSVRGTGRRGEREKLLSEPFPFTEIRRYRKLKG